MARSWMDDPKNFEQMRQNFTTALRIHGPNMNLPDMSERLCEFRDELDALRAERDAYRATLMDIAAVKHPDAVRSPHQEMARECVRQWEAGE